MKMCRQVQCTYLNHGIDTLKHIMLYLLHLHHFPQDQLINLRRLDLFLMYEVVYGECGTFPTMEYIG